MANFAESVDYTNGHSEATNGHNDVKRDPPSGIDVLIVGAGVGGLVAAIECHRKGHAVRIWERSESAVAGGKTTSPPSAS